MLDSVTSSSNVFEEVALNIDIERLNTLLGKLNTRERYVIEKMFGIGTGEPMTFQMLAKDLGMCRERTRNIFHKALRKLQTIKKT